MSCHSAVSLAILADLEIKSQKVETHQRWNLGSQTDGRNPGEDVDNSEATGHTEFKLAGKAKKKKNPEEFAFGTIQYWYRDKTGI